MDIINTYTSIRYTCLFTPLQSPSSTALITSSSSWSSSCSLIPAACSLLTVHNYFSWFYNTFFSFKFHLLNTTALAPCYSAATPPYPAPVPPAVSAPPDYLAPPAPSATPDPKPPSSPAHHIPYHHQVCHAPPTQHKLTELPPPFTFPSCLVFYSFFCSSSSFSFLSTSSSC